MCKSEKISVIIPAYNVQSFIRKAIDSALRQAEVGEVLVIDDGSTDGTYELALDLSETNSQIKVLKHKDRINKGRGATRNLGILNAGYDFISFLDADDFYLNNRFEKDLKTLSQSDIDGVYNAVGFHFYRDVQNKNSLHWKLNTLDRVVAPHSLFEALLDSRYGYLHLNGLTVRKKIFNKVGYFNEHLKVTQDTDLIFKMALLCKLMPSNISTVKALRGIHSENIFDKEDIYLKYRPILFESLIEWSIRNGVTQKRIDLLLNWLWFHKEKQKNSLSEDLKYWFRFTLKNPSTLNSLSKIKYFPIVRRRKQIFAFFR